MMRKKISQFLSVVLHKIRFLLRSLGENDKVLCQRIKRLDFSWLYSFCVKYEDSWYIVRAMFTLLNYYIRGRVDKSNFWFLILDKSLRPYIRRFLDQVLELEYIEIIRSSVFNKCNWDSHYHSICSNIRLMYSWRHYFNDIPYTVIPFFFGWAVFLCFFFLIVWLKKSFFFLPIGLLGLLFFCFIRWFSDMYVESSLRGRYGRKIRAALCCGFFLFLSSEVMLFGGFFWAYFDRFFNPSYIFDGYWIPAGINIIEFSRWPLVGTIILITSGYFANHSYYLLKAGDFLWHLLFGYAAIVLAISFLCIQLFEYNESVFTISDSVYGSFFYLLTGFHGFHVTVGFLFLVEQYERTSSMLDVEFPSWTLNRCTSCVYTSYQKSTFFSKLRYWGFRMNYPSSIYKNAPSTQCFICSRLYDVFFMFDRSIQLYNRQRHTGIVLSIVYWHFVDIIWIFLYYFVYIQAFRYI